MAQAAANQIQQFQKKQLSPKINLGNCPLTSSGPLPDRTQPTKAQLTMPARFTTAPSKASLTMGAGPLVNGPPGAPFLPVIFDCY